MVRAGYFDCVDDRRSQYNHGHNLLIRPAYDGASVSKAIYHTFKIKEKTNADSV
jgi:hypothetical protein